MMIRIAAAVAALALLTGCIRPEGTTAEDLAAFDEAIASIGCVLKSERHYLPVELQTGLPRDKIIEVATYKVSTRDAVALEGGGIRSVVGTCAPAEGGDVTVAQAT